MRRVLEWPFDRKEIKEFLATLGRQRGYINQALMLEVTYVNVTSLAQ